MSDEAPGAELDDLSTTPAPVEDTPPPAPVAVTTTPTDDIPVVEEGDPDKVKGLIGALKAEREKRKEAEAKAGRVSEVEAWYAGKKPYVDFLEQNPDFIKPRTEAAPAAPSADPKLVEIAKLFDFYTADGKPDLERAEKHRQLARSEAKAAADEQIAPYREASLKERHTVNYNKLLALRMPNGEAVNKEIVDRIWVQAASEPGGRESLGDERTAAALGVVVIGAQALLQGRMGPAPAQTTTAPLVTEPVGGSRVAGPQRMSALEEKVLTNKGIPAQRWTEHTKTFVKGRANTLEDD